MIDLISILLLMLSAIGTGREILRRGQFAFTNPFERATFAAGIGYGSLALTMLVLGIAGFLLPTVVAAVSVAWMVAGCYLVGVRGLVSRFRESRFTRDPWRLLVVGFIALGLVLTALKAAAPPHGATDPLAYQLALPKIFLQKGFLSFEGTITGALYPDTMNLLYAVGLALREGSLAQLIHWSTLFLCVVGVIGFGERYFNRDVGLCAGAIFLSMPLVTVFGTQGYVDVGLCFFQFLAFWALANWTQTRRTRELVLTGLLAGLAISTKHQGLATLVVAVPVIVSVGLRTSGRLISGLRLGALFLAIALALALPWYLRAWFMAGNPIWPLANGLFGGLPFGNSPVILSGQMGPDSGLLGGWIPSAKWWTSYLGAMSPWSWAFLKGGLQKATGIHFIALLPATVLGWRHPRLRRLMVFCLCYYVIIIRALHMNPRYGLVLFVFASAAAGWAAAYFSRHEWRPAALVFRAVFVSTLVLNVTWQYSLFEPVRDVVFGRETPSQFLRAREHNYGVFEFANQHLPAKSKVLLQGMVRGFYLNAPYMWDHPHQAILRYDDYTTPEDFLARLRKLGITHIARVIRVSDTRHAMGFPQYFLDPFHESFRQKYLKLLYRDQMCVLFEIHHGNGS